MPRTAWVAKGCGVLEGVDNASAVHGKERTMLRACGMGNGKGLHRHLHVFSQES